VTVKNLAGVAVTTLTGGETLVIGWASTGTITTISIVLDNSAVSLPDPVASSVNNAGSYTWVVPTGLAAGTYTVRVFWSSTVFARSASLVKSSGATTSSCSSPDCSGHGSCDEDTNGLCVCRFGYTGTTCSTAPAGIIRLSGSIKVQTAYSSFLANPTKFNTLFKTDLATALIMYTDQIEVTRVTQSGTCCSQVNFDVLLGGEFKASPLALSTSESLSTAIMAQLSSSDSALNRGTQSYAADNSTSLSGSSRTAVAGHTFGGFLLATAAAVVAALF
jgi:hypothetical protein